MKLKIYTGAEIRQRRLKLQRTQTELWGLLKTTQSGGSRFEGGRSIPQPIQLLLNITFGSDTHAKAIFDELRAFGSQKKCELDSSGSK